MSAQPPFTVQRLSWLRWSYTTALGLSVWCAGAALAFDAQGHRGARGLAPENTLAGIEQALAIGVTTLEFDVVLSAEGVPVVSHDTTPNPDITRDASGRWLQARGKPFNQLSLDEIASLDVGRINPSSRYARDFANQAPLVGERIPTLAAVFGTANEARVDHSQRLCRRVLTRVEAAFDGVESHENEDSGERCACSGHKKAAQRRNQP